MCALAAGPVWGLLAIWAQRSLGAFAFAVALAVAWALRANGWAGRWSSALLAALCVIFAALYSQALQAITEVAAMFGLPPRVAAREMGWIMSLDLARLRLRGRNLAFTLLAAFVAAWWTRRR